MLNVFNALLTELYNVPAAALLQSDLILIRLILGASFFHFANLSVSFIIFSIPYEEMNWGKS